MTKAIDTLTVVSIPEDHPDHTFVADVWTDGYVLVTLNNENGFIVYQQESHIHPSEPRDGTNTIERLISRITDEYVFPNKEIAQETPSSGA